MQTYIKEKWLMLAEAETSDVTKSQGCQGLTATTKSRENTWKDSL